ncbi:hypothetical protein J9874_03961 (plasmid) [Duffyella gerundensis]|uniref:protein phosphatase 2C domain-containing protein n=2 Tax=Duffyella gerundensis TaxID=1619313 RepID=UPI001CE34AD0|nr:protein phosphatase 2C domain-containing protein [Duffyella gerundensis]UCB33378.1 hypothetical protein J9874_03961 [Duffyella gerundensis]
MKGSKKWFKGYWTDEHYLDKYSGAQRNANNDYVAVKADEEQLIAVIVDAAERGGNAQRFAEHWATLLLTTYTQPTRLPLNILLRELHKTLVPEFLHERGSYSLVDIDLRNNSGEIIYVGDCLLAVVTGSQTYRVNQPHVINHTFTSLGDSYAHILTRVLKANRFMPPERIGFTWQQGDKLLLSTDGYWQRQADGQTQCSDDASALYIIPDGSGCHFTAETEYTNFRFYIESS